MNDYMNGVNEAGIIQICKAFKYESFKDNACVHKEG